MSTFQSRVGRADSGPFWLKRSVTSSLAFFLGPICFWTSLILALIWVAEYAAAKRRLQVSTHGRLVLLEARLTPAMVLEHGDHVVDIFDSGKTLALALPDLFRIAAALSNCSS